ncbi:MAG: hypothetical protein ABI629_16970, partial [bacterium]
AARWAGRPRLGIAVIGAVTVASLVGNMYRRGDPRDIEPIAMNLHAVQGLGAYLRGAPDGLIVVTSYNLAQMPDALSGRPSLRVDQDLEQCANAPDAEACERQTIAAVLDAIPQARFLVPLRTGAIDKPPSKRIVATIEAVARARGAAVREEARFATRPGEPVLALLVVTRPAAAAAAP